MELVKGLECEWDHAHRVEKRFGVTIRGVPHWDLSRLLKNCIYRPYVVGSEKIRILKQADVENFIRAETGVEWFAWGMRAADSVVRNAYLKRIQGVDPKSRRVYPIWTWKKPDVYGWLHGRKLPVPGITGGKAQMGGISLDAPTLAWLRDKCPHRAKGGRSRCFDKILDVFPFAEAAVIQMELAQRGSKEDPAPRIAKAVAR
jgi:hypothetical protein